jgi:hypothetical protein
MIDAVMFIQNLTAVDRKEQDLRMGFPEVVKIDENSIKARSYGRMVVDITNLIYLGTWTTFGEACNVLISRGVYTRPSSNEI